MVIDVAETVKFFWFW